MQKTSPQAATDSPDDGLSPLVGQVLLGKYRLERELGRGGMGVVFAAEHLLLGQQVALKMMLPALARDPDAAARFLNEGRAAARLENEHVARVMDVGLLRDGTPFLVLELLEGRDLAAILQESGPLPVARVVDCLLQAMEAIAEAHSLGIVHRDLKPSNLFVAERKGGSTLKVLDFGISKALAEDPAREQVITATNAVLGSPAYMPPEQLRNARDLDGRADLWSLGVIAYELLTGTLPYTGPNVVALFAAIQERSPRPISELRPDVPPAIEAAILRCLCRDVAERWPSVLGLATTLAPFGTPSARASLSRIETLVAEPLSVPSDERAIPRARVSVPDTDPNNLPSKTMLAAAGSNPDDAPARARSTGGGSLTRTTGGVAKVLDRPARGARKRFAAIAFAVVLATIALAAFFLRRAPRPTEGARVQSSAPPIEAASPEQPTLPAAAAPASVTPAAAPIASSPPASTVTSPRPRTAVPAAKLAPPSPSSKPPQPQKGVPSDWN